MSRADGAVLAPAAGPGAGASSLLASEARKLRRTWVFPLTVLGPLGVTLLGVILFLLRGSWILKPYRAGTSSAFAVLVNNLGMIQVFCICLGATLLASMIADVEHRSDGWKSLFAMPVSRAGTYVAKFAWAAGLLFVSSLLMAAGYQALAWWQGLGALAATDLWHAAVWPWVGVLPLLAFQSLVSTVVKNQALPITLGTVTPMFGMGMSSMPAWLPWRLPTQALVAVFGGVPAGSPGAALAWLTPSVMGLIAGAWVVGLVAVGAGVLSARDV